MISACLFFCLMALGGSESTVPVPWNEVRTTVAELICVVTVPLASGQEARVTIVGDPKDHAASDLIARIRAAGGG